MPTPLKTVRSILNCYRLIRMELGLWLESERMLHANIQNIVVETQREVVKEEKRQRVDNQPYGSWLENMMKRLYTEHPQLGAYWFYGSL